MFRFHAEEYFIATFETTLNRFSRAPSPRKAETRPWPLGCTLVLRGAPTAKSLMGRLFTIANSGLMVEKIESS